MHIAIAGPIATADLAPLLDASAPLPRGYAGAPLMATLIRELLARGHRVSAVTLSSDLPLAGGARVVRGPGGLALFCVPMRPKAWPFNGRHPGRIVDLYRHERRGLVAALRSAQAEVVHAHWSYEFAWAALDSGLPHVVTCHDAPIAVARMSTGLRRRGYRWLRAAMARHVLGRARCVTTVSPYMQAQLADWCTVSMALVPNPIDAAAFGSRRHEVAGRARVCMVSNGWSRFKNAEPALEAFAAFSARRPGAQLVACGDDFEPGGRAERWWRAEGLRGDVVFRGPARHADVLALMADSDVLLHPSLEESFGMVVAEALAVGLPVIAGSASGAVPWVAGRGARLVDVSRAEPMARALARHFADPRAGHARSVRARADVAVRFAAATVADGYESQYRQAIASQRERPSPRR